jgi:hypothetical protein
MGPLDYSAFIFTSLQATIFTPDEGYSTAKVMTDFYPKLAKILDADPQVLPSAPGLPPEIPRITLMNRDDTLRLQISPVRVNLFGMVAKDAEPDAEQFYKQSIEIFSDYHKLLACRVGRLAAAVKRYARHETPGLFLARHFCKEEWSDKPLNRPEGLELHAHKKYELSLFSVNSWVRSKTGQLQEEDTRIPIVLVEQDINTLAEDSDKKSFASEEIKEFFSIVLQEFDNILQLYYP